MNLQTKILIPVIVITLTLGLFSVIIYHDLAKVRTGMEKQVEKLDDDGLEHVRKIETIYQHTWFLFSAGFLLSS